MFMTCKCLKFTLRLCGCCRYYPQWKTEFKALSAALRRLTDHITTCVSGSTRPGGSSNGIVDHGDPSYGGGRSGGDTRDASDGGVAVCSPLCVRARKTGCKSTDVIRDAKLEALDAAISPFIDTAQCDATQDSSTERSALLVLSSSDSSHSTPIPNDGMRPDTESANLHGCASGATTTAHSQILSETPLVSADTANSALVSLSDQDASYSTEANGDNGQPPHSPVLATAEASSPHTGYLCGGGNPFAALLGDDDEDDDDADDDDDD